MDSMKEMGYCNERETQCTGDDELERTVYIGLLMIC